MGEGLVTEPNLPRSKTFGNLSETRLAPVMRPGLRTDLRPSSAVVSVRGATRLFKDGEPITIDGHRGRVHVGHILTEKRSTT